MSFNPQILQQVQDSVVPSPILVVPFKPLNPDTNTANEKNTTKPNKENQNSPKKALNNNLKKEIHLSELKIDTTPSFATIDTSTRLTILDTSFTERTDSITAFKQPNNENLKAPIKYRTSLFTNHELKTNYFETKERNQNSSDWIIITILLIIFFFLLNKVLNPKKWAKQLKIIFSKRAFEQQLRDEKDFRSPFLFLQFIASSLTITLFIYQLFYNKAININSYAIDYLFYLKILVTIIVLLIIYFVSHKIAGFILNKGKLVSEYLLSTLLLYNITGTFLLPLCIGLEYVRAIPNHIILKTGLLLLLFSFLFKLYKGLTIASSYNSLHLFYLFLYICSLEILPIAIAIKFISDNF